MSLNPETSEPSLRRTTAAGLESWLSGEPVEQVQTAGQMATGEPTMAAVLAATADLGPVNAAEALALGTISAARRLVGPDGAELVVDPEQDAYYFESTALKPLAVLLQQSASAWTPVYSEAVKTMRAAHPPQRLPRLRWYAGLIATPGILSRELHRAGRFKLSCWPETEREFPQHFRIAKEMLKDAATTEEILAASGMPYDQVIDYINASHAGGRLAAMPVGKSPGKPTRRQRLIARLNKPLFVR